MQTDTLRLIPRSPQSGKGGLQAGDVRMKHQLFRRQPAQQGLADAVKQRIAGSQQHDPPPGSSVQHRSQPAHRTGVGHLFCGQFRECVQMRWRPDQQFCGCQCCLCGRTEHPGTHPHADHLDRWAGRGALHLAHQNRTPWLIRAKAFRVAAARLLPPRRPRRVMHGV